jgi:haloalkane dehalogenase
VNTIVASYVDWFVTSNARKPFVKAEPGLLVAGSVNLDFTRRLPAQTEVTAAGVHYLHEGSPDEIGRTIAGWVGTLAGIRANQPTMTGKARDR